MKNRSSALIAVASALLLTVAGCGSDDKDKPAETTAPTAQSAPQAQGGEPTSPDEDDPDPGTPDTYQHPPTSTRFNVAKEKSQRMFRVLDSLPVHPKGSIKGYSGKRTDLFGPAWSDKAQGVAMAGNSCDTRDDILARDLSSVKKKDDCTVMSGSFIDPYTGKEINYKRGRATSSAVQIDHLVALGNVWVSGGDKLSESKRLAIANDPDNLLAVDGPSNGAKGDSDASEWLPENSKIHCWYVISQIDVKDKYHLSVTQSERAAMDRVLRTECPK